MLGQEGGAPRQTPAHNPATNPFLSFFCLLSKSRPFVANFPTNQSRKRNGREVNSFVGWSSNVGRYRRYRCRCLACRRARRSRLADVPRSASTMAPTHVCACLLPTIPLLSAKVSSLPEGARHGRSMTTAAQVRRAFVTRMACCGAPILIVCQLAASRPLTSPTPLHSLEGASQTTHSTTSCTEARCPRPSHPQLRPLLMQLRCRLTTPPSPAIATPSRHLAAAPASPSAGARIRVSTTEGRCLRPSRARPSHPSLRPLLMHLRCRLTTPPSPAIAAPSRHLAAAPASPSAGARIRVSTTTTRTIKGAMLVCGSRQCATAPLTTRPTRPLSAPSPLTTTLRASLERAVPPTVCSITATLATEEATRGMEVARGGRGQPCT